MKFILLTLFAVISITGLSQDERELITERSEKSILKGMVSSVPYELIIGQSYDISVLASTTHDLKINTKNLDIVLDSSCFRSTGAYRYTVTPLEVGDCRLSVGLIIDEKKSVSLFSRLFRAIEPPAPSIYINRIVSGKILGQLDKSTSITCTYPSTYVIEDNFPIKRWKAELNGEQFEGQGKVLSNELQEAINSCSKRSSLYIKVSLEENATGHSETEAIYIVKNQ